jgi:hypothetical protein
MGRRFFLASAFADTWRSFATNASFITPRMGKELIEHGRKRTLL